MPLFEDDTLAGAIRKATAGLGRQRKSEEDNNRIRCLQLATLLRARTDELLALTTRYDEVVEDIREATRESERRHQDLDQSRENERQMSRIALFPEGGAILSALRAFDFGHLERREERNAFTNILASLEDMFFPDRRHDSDLVRWGQINGISQTLIEQQGRLRSEIESAREQLWALGNQVHECFPLPQPQMDLRLTGR